MNPWALLADICFIIVIGIAVAVINENGQPSAFLDDYPPSPDEDTQDLKSFPWTRPDAQNGPFWAYRRPHEYKSHRPGAEPGFHRGSLLRLDCLSLA